MRTLVVAIALVVIGAGGGYVVGVRHGAAGDAVAPAVRAGAAAAVPASAVVAVADRGMSEAEMRRIVAEEMAAHRGTAEGSDAAAAAAPVASAASVAAYDEGMRRVNQALVQRRWTRDDAAALGRALDTATPEQRTQLLHALMPALNRGEVKLTYKGDLF